MNSVTILTLNAPTATGRIYPTAVVQRALGDLCTLDGLPPKPIPGIVGNLEHEVGCLVNLADVKFTVAGARIEGDLVIGDLTFLAGTEDWQALLRSGEAAVRLAGEGRVDETTKLVSDYTIKAACLVSASTLIPA